MNPGNARHSVLVLGVGGNVGQGILKALDLIGGQRPRVVAACVDAHAAGLYTSSRALISPLAKSPGFLDWLIVTCNEEKISGIFSGVEPVLEVLAENAARIRECTHAVAVVSPLEPLRIAGDKLRTCEWLRGQGLEYPDFVPSGDPDAAQALAARKGFPVIAKPRAGKGSQGVFLVNNRAELDRAVSLSNYVIQENLGDPSHEYTAATFRDRDGKRRGSIVMRRELKDGTTVLAEAGEHPGIAEYAEAITDRLKPAGPCNIQLRLSNGRPVCFEINCRFSGTTPIRARFGFNDVELAYRHFVLGEDAYDLPPVRRGVAIRYWNEIYVAEDAVHCLQANGRLEDPGSFPSHAESYGTRP